MPFSFALFIHLPSYILTSDIQAQSVSTAVFAGITYGLGVVLIRALLSGVIYEYYPQYLFFKRCVYMALLAFVYIVLWKRSYHFRV
ncbi:MAG: hypothetical protein Q9M40_12500, partial [Sulfurimonas sp.]|nr:hypothetical protein [Sulfurimonas sp.]